MMVRGHDPHRTTRSFWFTPGGGREAGESARECAVRELREETGYVVAAAELVGPVWRRTAVFDFASRPYTQHEEFFVAVLTEDHRRGRVQPELTADEHEALDALAWLSQDELAAESREVFPARLRSAFDEFLAWDGVTRDFGEENE